MHSKSLKKYVILLSFAFIMAGMVDVAFAAPPSCSFVGGASAGAVSFSTIDPSTTPGPIYGNVTQQVSFTCNKLGIAYTITVSPASGWTLQSGPNALSYTLGIASSGTYAGTPVDLLIPSGAGASLIIQANYQNVPAGAYQNGSAITITVSFGGPFSPIIATIPIANLSGTVINTCTVSQSAGTLTFNMDPSVSGTTNATISQDLKIKCTKNASPISITATSACGALDSSYPVCGGSKIPYTFNYLTNAVGNGFGTGNDISLGIGGSTSSVNYVNATSGTYGDQQTITVSY